MNDNRADEDASASITFPGPKGPDALRTIGEVATALGIRQHVLRYWEEQFPMLRPVKRSGGRRYYRPEDVTLLRTIHRLVDQEGYTLRGARLSLEAAAKAPAKTATPPAPVTTKSAVVRPIGYSTDTLARLRQVRRVLSEALAAS